MRFGLVHRVFVDAMVTLGLVAILTTNELGRVLQMVVIALLALALLVPPRFGESPLGRRLGTILPLVLLALEVARLLVGVESLTVAIEFAVGIQLVRVATRRGAIHDPQIIALSLLHLIVATVLGGGLSYAVCLAAFILLAPPTLVLSHLRREVEGNYRQGARDRTGLPVDVPRILRSRRVMGRGYLLFVGSLSLPVFLFTGALFVAFPRVGLSLLMLSRSQATRTIGFSDRVDLGGMGPLESDATLTMRLFLNDLPAEPPPRISLYFRGTAFDQYDGRSWSRTDTRRWPLERSGSVVSISRLPDPVRDPGVIVELAPLDQRVLFVPLDVVAVELLGQRTPLLDSGVNVVLGPEGELRYTQPNDALGLRYRVFRAPHPEPSFQQVEGELARYLTLPPTNTTRLRQLALDWAGGERDPERIAAALEARLRRDFAYALDTQSGAAPDPLVDFLFVSRRGHCEYFSTALAVLLRTLGVPTRNVTGFGSATFNRFGRFYAVRQSDAHSWVEIWVKGRGWRQFDPTPAVDPRTLKDDAGWLGTLRELIEASSQKWNRHVEGYDLDQQLRLLRGANQSTQKLRHALNQIWHPALLLIPLVLGPSFVLARWLWRRRARLRVPKGTRVRAADLAIIELYKKLEAALAAAGFARHLGTPPRSHALALAQLEHPEQAEVLALTERYLEIRFGGDDLSADEHELLRSRVAALRQRLLASARRSREKSGSISQS